MHVNMNDIGVQTKGIMVAVRAINRNARWKSRRVRRKWRMGDPLGKEIRGWLM